MNNIFFAYLHSCGISQKKLIQIFVDPSIDSKDFFETLDSKKLKEFFTASQIEKIIQTKDKLDTTQIKTLLLSLQVKIITFFDNEYPEALKNISNPPFLLYVRGSLDNSPKLAVVGSRNITQY